MSFYYLPRKSECSVMLNTPKFLQNLLKFVCEKVFRSLSSVLTNVIANLNRDIFLLNLIFFSQYLWQILLKSYFWYRDLRKWRINDAFCLYLCSRFKNFRIWLQCYQMKTIFQLCSALLLYPRKMYLHCGPLIDYHNTNTTVCLCLGQQTWEIFLSLILFYYGKYLSR